MDRLRAPIRVGNVRDGGLAACWQRIQERWNDPQIVEWANAIGRADDLPASGVVPYLSEVAIEPEEIEEPASDVDPRSIPAGVPETPPGGGDLDEARRRAAGLALSWRYRLGDAAPSARAIATSGCSATGAPAGSTARPRWSWMPATAAPRRTRRRRHCSPPRRSAREPGGGDARERATVRRARDPRAGCQVDRHRRRCCCSFARPDPGPLTGRLGPAQDLRSRCGAATPGSGLAIEHHAALRAAYRSAAWIRPRGVRLHDGSGKATRLVADAPPARLPSLLGALVLLRERDPERLRLEPIEPARAVPQLVPGLIFGGSDRLAVAFSDAARLAGSAPVYAAR